MTEPDEVYIADFAEAGPHPVIVVSREDLNRGRYALVVVCTSARFAVRSTLPNCVPFQAGQFGFTAECVAQCENILSMSPSDGAASWASFYATLEETSARIVFLAVLPEYRRRGIGTALHHELKAPSRGGLRRRVRSTR